MASDSLWFYLEVDKADAADPVKQRGPLTVDDMHELWKKKSIDDETYVWADGMADFAQIKDVVNLKSAFAPTTAAASPTPILTPAPAAASTPAPASAPVATSSAVAAAGIMTWYYKNKQGVKLGPSVLDTLKIMWDFGEVRSLVVCLVPDCFSSSLVRHYRVSSSILRAFPRPCPTYEEDAIRGFRPGVCVCEREKYYSCSINVCRSSTANSA